MPIYLQNNFGLFYTKYLEPLIEQHLLQMKILLWVALQATPNKTAEFCAERWERCLISIAFNFTPAL